MKKYGIDIVNEWGNVPDKGKGIRYFDDISEAMKWGDKYTDEDDPVACGFMIFESDIDEVIYHSFFKESYSINSRFEILDFEEH